ncbi:uncharacterized protein LOC116345071 [Contarinia nasturtii]|uniref:uncharacterized protein LOC116345071 n=1 Tax=Contarinia nasturtii TaxID=265458 RepID=UPI0012D3CB47|nr:uncharacterized protein LOC116345071 [Contarinia nasturtii]
MIIKCLNITKTLTKSNRFHLIRTYCQNSNKNEAKSFKTVDNHEAKLLGVLNKFNSWESCKHVLTETNFNLIQKWKTENGGSIKNFDEIPQIDGINKEISDDLRKFCESQLQIDGKKSDDALNHEQYLSTSYSNSLIDDASFFAMHHAAEGPSDETILEFETFSPTQSDNSMEKPKPGRLTIKPAMDKDTKFDTFTSIYQDSIGIACAKFSAKGGEIFKDWNMGFTIENWNYLKMDTRYTKNILSLHHRMNDVIHKVPKSEIYLLDDHIIMQRFHRPVLPTQIADICQLNQQAAFLIGFLQEKDENCPNLYLMSYKNVGKYYNMSMGHEIVSNINVTQNILHNPNITLDVHSAKPNILAFEVNKDMKDTYFKSNSLQRECLGRSLLLGLTFLQLRVVNKKKKAKKRKKLKDSAEENI